MPLVNVSGQGARHPAVRSRIAGSLEPLYPGGFVLSAPRCVRFRRQPGPESPVSASAEGTKTGNGRHPGREGGGGWVREHGFSKKSTVLAAFCPDFLLRVKGSGHIGQNAQVRVQVAVAIPSSPADPCIRTSGRPVPALQQCRNAEPPQRMVSLTSAVHRGTNAAGYGGDETGLPGSPPCDSGSILGSLPESNPVVAPFGARPARGYRLALKARFIPLRDEITGLGNTCGRRGKKPATGVTGLFILCKRIRCRLRSHAAGGPGPG